MSVERRGNPFGWILLGFVVGVLATFGTILFLTAGLGGYDQGGPEETRTVADDAASAAMGGSVSPASTPRRIDTPMMGAAPPAADTAAPSRNAPAPSRSTPPIDAQMADDAAAAGMTSREQPTN